MKKILLLIVASISIVSCVEEIVMDPKERIVVVECILEDKETQSVSLRYSSYLSENNYPYVEEAYVRIDEYKKGQYRYLKDKEYKFRKTEEGVWKANFTPRPNYKYELTILIPETDTITATTIYLGGSTIAAINDLHNNSMGVDSLGFGRTLTIEDTSTTLFPSCRLGQSLIPRPRTFYFWVYGMDYDPIKDEYSQADLISIPYHDSYYQLAIEDDFYNFLDFFNVLDIKRGEVEEFKYPTNPGVKFPEILEYGFPQYMHGSYNGASNSMHYKYLRMHYSYSYPKEEGWIGTLTNVFATQMHIAVNFKQYKYGVAHPKSYLVFMAVNTDYDKYLKDLVTYTMEKKFKTESDLSNIYDIASPVYTNIKNGKGIFGARYINTIPYQDYKSVIYNGVTYNKTKNLEETP